MLPTSSPDYAFNPPPTGFTLTPPPQSSGSGYWPGYTCSHACPHSSTASGKMLVSVGYGNARPQGTGITAGDSCERGVALTRVCNLSVGGGPSKTKTGLMR